MVDVTSCKSLLQDAISFFLQTEKDVFPNQERVIQKARTMFVGELLCVGQHRVTQMLLSLGLGNIDWSKWYRLYSSGQFREEVASRKMVEEILRSEKGKTSPIPFVIDGVKIARTSKHFPGVFLQPCPFTVGKERGMWYIQRFLNMAFLAKSEEKGYCEAIPVRFLPSPARTSKNLPEGCEPKTLGEAALESVWWLSNQIRSLGHHRRQVLVVCDGEFEQNQLWNNLPPGVIWLVKTKRNRSLYFMAEKEPGKRGRPKIFGDKAGEPHMFNTRKKEDLSIWKRFIRGKERTVKYKVEGPFLVEEVPNQPLFLIVIPGGSYVVKGKKKRRKPMYFLVNAVKDSRGEWKLPVPVEELIYWQWQRWEVEVCHREMKSGFGLGDKQCWNPLSSILSCQWSVWVYAILRWFGYKHRMLLTEEVAVGRWYKKRRWSIQLLLQCYRLALWHSGNELDEFFPEAPGSPPLPGKNQGLLARMWHSATGAYRV